MILQGNCLDVLKDFPDNSIDCCVTDPPYGLSFMGKKWDYDVPSTEIWKEVLRVLKPGAASLAFCGSGSTGVAANNLSRDFVGVEMNPEYVLIAEKRTKTA